MNKLLLFLFTISLTRISAQELQPTLKEAVLNVLVIDDKKAPQAGQMISFISKTSGKDYSRVTGADGKFSMLLPTGAQYQVKYRIFNETRNGSVLDMPADKVPYTFDYTITAIPPKTFTLRDVFFDSGKSTLRAESDKELDQLAEYMSLKKSLVVEIAGHTDNVGSPESNQKLSEDRAKSVKQYLLKKGIASARVVPKGYGDTQPVADNSSEAGRQQNRRTEVRIITE